MSDSRLNCDFPETNIQQPLEKRFYRTFDERLASPPARKVEGVTDRYRSILASCRKLGAINRPFKCGHLDNWVENR